MSSAASRSVPALSFDPPDPQFRLVVGLYVAMLVVPVVLYGTTGVGVSDPASLYGVFLASGLVVVAAVTWGLGRVDGGAVRLGASPVRWLLWLPAAVLAAGSFAVLPQVGGAAIAGFFLGAFGIVAGFTVGAMARSRYVKAVIDTTGADAEWTAGWPDSAKNRLTLVAGGLVVVAILSFAVDALRLEIGGFWYLGQFLLPFGVILLTYAQPQDYAVIDAGLTVERGGFRRLYLWDCFTGYTRTDDGIVCHRPRRVDVRFALADLDDPEAVERAVDQYLDRTAV